MTCQFPQPVYPAFFLKLKRLHLQGRPVSGLLVFGREWLLPLVAQKLESQVTAQRHLVSSWTAIESARFQLAQHHRLLVCCAVIHRRVLGPGDFVYVGWESCVPRRRRDSSSAAC